MPINTVPVVAAAELTSQFDSLITTINALTEPKVGYAEKTDTAAATLTAAEITTGRDISVVNMTGNIGGALTLTLPTVALTVAALQAKFGSNVNVVGTSWLVRVMKTGTGAFAWTLTTATGWGTLGGTLTVLQTGYRDFILTITSATTGTVQGVGAGTAP